MYDGICGRRNMAKLQIPITSQNQLDHIFAAEQELSKAGVYFHVGSDLHGDPKRLPITRVWELDWSLHGAELQEEHG